jgi:hypothetical protein
MSKQKSALISFHHFNCIINVLVLTIGTDEKFHKTKCDVKEINNDR